MQWIFRGETFLGVFAAGRVNRKTVGSTTLYNRSVPESRLGRQLGKNVNSLNKINQLQRCVLTFLYSFVFCVQSPFLHHLSVSISQFLLSHFLLFFLFFSFSWLFYDLVLHISLTAFLYSYPPNSLAISLHALCSDNSPLGENGFLLTRHYKLVLFFY